jgi:hypothetical protein
MIFSASDAPGIYRCSEDRGFREYPPINSKLNSLGVLWHANDGTMTTPVKSPRPPAPSQVTTGPSTGQKARNKQFPPAGW